MIDKWQATHSRPNSLFLLFSSHNQLSVSARSVTRFTVRVEYTFAQLHSNPTLAFPCCCLILVITIKMKFSTAIVAAAGMFGLASANVMEPRHWHNATEMTTVVCFLSS